MVIGIEIYIISFIRYYLFLFFDINNFFLAEKREKLIKGELFDSYNDLLIDEN